MRRVFSVDQLFAGLMLGPILLLLVPLLLLVLIVQGRPVFHYSERMRTPRDAFTLYKIRTMDICDSFDDERVLGGDRDHRVTRLGGFLRRSRLDELPQIFNVLRGDIGFIGPRPPLRRHVNAQPEKFGAVFAGSRPGITGLATVKVHQREEALLAACKTAEEAEEIYLTKCLPMKFRFDLIYAQKSNLRLNLLILWMTVAKPFARREKNRPLRSPQVKGSFSGLRQIRPV